MPYENIHSPSKERRFCRYWRYITFTVILIVGIVTVACILITIRGKLTKY